MRTSDIVRKLRKCGLRVTPQRMAVLRAVLELRSHPTAEEVFERVRSRLPSCSKSTVYHALDAVIRKGLVGELLIRKECVNYEPDPGTHDHAYCERCGKILNVPKASLESDLPPEIKKQFRVRTRHVVYYGTCAGCERRRRGR